MIGICWSLICLKTLMQIFNPCGEFRWSPEGPVSQIHSPPLHAVIPGIFSDLLRSVQMLKREWGAESNRTYPSLVKLQPGFLSLRWKTCLWAELWPWFLSFQWRTWPWAEHSDGDECKASHPITSYCSAVAANIWTLASISSMGLMACNGDTFTLLLI